MHCSLFLCSVRHPSLNVSLRCWPGSLKLIFSDFCNVYNYIAARINNHNEIAVTEELNHSSYDLVILLTYCLWAIDV